MKILIKLSYLILFISLIGCNVNSGNVISPNSILVSKSGEQILVADETANRIRIIKQSDSKDTKQIDLDDMPTGFALSDDDKKLYCTIGVSEGQLLEIDLENYQVKRALKVGHSPVAPVLSANQQILYLCNRFENSISSIDLNSFTITKKVKVDREPVALALSEKENKLYVVNHLPNGSAIGAYHSSKISVIDTRSFNLIKEISLPNGSNALNAICISPDEEYAYVTHILARYNVPTNQVERGWINTNALSIIDLKSNNYLCTVLLDDLDLGAANPYDVKCSKNGDKLLVSHSGTSELSVIARNKLHNRILQTQQEPIGTVYARSLDQIKDDLSFLQDIRIRIQLKGKGAKSIALTNQNAYVSMYYSATICEVNLTNMSHSADILLGEQTMVSQERLGEMYFNDATLCKQNWQSCASCHPGNARVDALNWDNLNDGVGNPKNTKSLLLAHVTAPSMITGIRPDAEGAVRAGIEHILFTNQPEEIAQAIDAYLMSLSPISSPYLKNGKLSESAERGKLVFQKAQCNECHSGPYLTNLEKFDVGVGTDLEEGRKFDTPSLIEIWRTAPYLYNGKAKDLKEVFTKYNKTQKHGKTAQLSHQELEDLIEYCLTL
jgi:DNA-binding beta-propeller fold protein YncE/cytochrome c peroxidase